MGSLKERERKAEDGVSGPERAERDRERRRGMRWGLGGKNKARADCLCFGRVLSKKIFTTRKSVCGVRNMASVDDLTTSLKMESQTLEISFRN